jgi:hypothetical protein
MRKGIRSAGLGVVCLSVAAAAQPVDRPYEDAGCARLEAIVYEQVLASRYGLPAAGSIVPMPRSPMVEACASTTRAVSAGYTKAMSRLAVEVTWLTPERQRGDVCLSHFLSQCYPDVNPYLAPDGSDTHRFVVGSWNAVRDTVVRTMPDGVATDVSRFSAHAFEKQLRAKLERRGGRELRRR